MIKNVFLNHLFSDFANLSNTKKMKNFKNKKKTYENNKK